MIKNWILNWVAEKSTIAGFFSLASVYGLNLPSNVQDILITLAVSFMAMPDRKNI